MAIKTKRTVVSSTAVAVTLADTDITSKGFVILKNAEAASAAVADWSVFIGATGVTTATGFRLAPGESTPPLELKNNESLFAIASAANGVTIHTLQYQA